MDTLQKIVTSTNYSAPAKIADRETKSPSILPERIGKRGVSSPIVSYFSSRSFLYTDYDRFTGHEYDLYEYARIIDTESIAYKAFERKKALLFKNGYLFKSDSDDNISYIKQRLREFKHVSGVSFEQFIDELAYNLIVFHNAYCLFHRNEDKSGGEIRIANNSEIKPIAAVFNFPTESIERALDDDGRALKYRQRVDSATTRVFQARDVKHLTYNKRSGFTMGTPPLEPVKDDILALRRIEESIETLIYKSLFPIIHVKVGTDQNPAQTLRDGTSEVAAMSSVLRELDDSGGVVTSERVEIKSIGAESLALRVESYLNHFQERVMIGLGVSSTDLGIGDSSGKATGTVISQTLKEAVTDMQRVLADFITKELFTELLLESGKYKASYEIPEEELVYLVFNSVDHDAQIKIESHYLNLMNSGAITVQEFRKETGRRPMTSTEMSSMGKWEESRLPPHQIKSVEAATKSTLAGIEAAKEAASSTTATTSTGSQQTKAQGAANSSSSIVSPKNQYTDSIKEEDELIKALLPIRDNKLLVAEQLKNHIEPFIDIKDYYMENMLHDIYMNIADTICSLGKDNLHNNMSDLVTQLYMEVGEVCQTL